MVTLTNLITNGDFEGTGWSGGSYDQTRVLFGAYSYKLVGSAGSPEVLANMSGTISMIPSHTYYVGWYVYHEGAPGTCGCYFGIAEPSFNDGLPLGPAGQWNRVGAVNNRSSFAQGNQGFRLDYNNGGQAGTVWFDGLVLVDLTAAFGAGSEPDATWCNSHIPFFIGTKDIDVSDHTYTDIDYIEGSSAGQYIDTQYRPYFPQTTVEADCQAVTTTAAVFGVRTSSSAQSFTLWALYDDSWRFDRWSANAEYPGTPLVRTTVRMAPTQIAYGSTTITVTAYTGMAPGSLYITGVNRVGTSSDPRSAMRIYGLKIWHADVIVRDYRPVRREDGAVGLIDDVTGFFSASGSNAYAAGPDSHPASVTVMLYDSGGTTTQEVAWGSTLTLPTGTNGKGDFVGWWDGDELLSGSLTPTEDMTLIARYDLVGSVTTVDEIYLQPNPASAGAAVLLSVHAVQTSTTVPRWTDMVLTADAGLPMSSPYQIGIWDTSQPGSLATFEGDGIPSASSAGMIAGPISALTSPIPRVGVWSSGISDASGAISFRIYGSGSQEYTSSIEVLSADDCTITAATVTYTSASGATSTMSATSATDTIRLPSGTYKSFIIEVTAVSKPYSHVRVLNVAPGGA